MRFRINLYRILIQGVLFIAFSIMFFPGGLEFISPQLFFIIDKMKFPTAFLMITCSLLFGKRRQEIPKVIVITVIMYGYLTFVSFCEDANWRLVVKESFLAVAVLIMIWYNRKDSFKVLSPLLASLEWQIYLNLITIFLFPNGMYQEQLSGNVSNWILGYDNSWNYLFFPALFIAIICRYLSGDSKRFWLLLIVMEFQSFYRWSIMCSFGFVVFDLLFLLRFYKGKIFNVRNYAIIAVMAMIVILFFRNNISFLETISMAIGKDLYSMSNRSYIWMKAVEFIKIKPIFGYGRISVLDVAMSYYINKDAVHAHNMPLELLFRGGIALFIIYFTGLIISVKELLKNKNEEFVQVLSIAYLSVFLMMITQVYLSPLSIVMIMLGGFSTQFVYEMHSRTQLRSRKKVAIRI